MKNSKQKKELKDKLEKKIKTLKKRLNPFNKNFSITDRETILKEINTISEQITKLKQELLNNNPEHLKQFESENQKFNNDLEISTEDQDANDITFLIPVDNITNDDIYNINSEEEIIKMQYGNNCCPCTIL